MRLNDYQDQAMETAVYPPENGITYAILGLTNEAGELAGALKKHLRGDYDQVEMKRRVIDELGDVLWYAASVAEELELDLEVVARANLSKLAARAAKNGIRGDGENR
jgi:NTP pyrophosphatase (non-canonical NTP hydrolase)